MLEYRMAQHDGELAQLVERCDRTAEVRSSNLLFSMYVKEITDNRALTNFVPSALN